jgi:hypothetical protein
MRRRECLLYVGAVVGMAGCTDSDSQGSPTNETSASPTATTTSLPTATTTEPPTETTTETRTPTETETESQPTLDRHEQESAEQIAAAREDLRAAYDEFVGDGDSLLSVDASHDFTYPSVTNPVREAVEHLDEAGRGANRHQESDIATLRTVGDFLSWTARAQEALSQGRQKAETAAMFCYDQQGGQMDVRREGMDEERATADDLVTKLRTETSEDAIESLSYISEDEYNDKIAALEDELAALAALHDAIKEFFAPISNFSDGIYDYLSDDWSSAESRFDSAQAQGDDSVVDFESISSPLGFQALVFELTGGARAIRDAASDLSAAAVAGSEENEDEQQTRETNADAELRESDAVVNHVDAVDRWLNRV